MNLQEAALIIQEKRLGPTKLKMGDGSIRNFKSPEALERFERVARAVKHNPKFAKIMAARKKG